jgi:hypothetical protein
VSRSCCACDRAEDLANRVELRPYGPGGKPICFDCAMQPDRLEETERNFNRKLDAAGSVVVLTSDGPAPLKGIRE